MYANAFTMRSADTCRSYMGKDTKIAYQVIFVCVNTLFLFDTFSCS